MFKNIKVDILIVKSELKPFNIKEISTLNKNQNKILILVTSILYFTPSDNPQLHFSWMTHEILM